MRFARNGRKLKGPERDLATSVFGQSLPDWKFIYVSDGLGLGDAPWTDQGIIGCIMQMGPTAYPDLTSSTQMGGFGRVRDVFIHEMTHVWQYDHGYWVKLGSLWSRATSDDAYAYTVGKDWDDYNVEQQAQIVEDWFSGGMSTTDARFQYIRDVIRKG